MFKTITFATLLLLTACGGNSSESDDPTGSDPGACLPADCSVSSAATGTLDDNCQVNVFCDDADFAVYCYLEDEGWDCSCGAAVDDPPSFVTDDFCDLDFQAAACEARELCSNWTF